MINQSLLLAGDDAYNLSKSLRLRSSASAYLNRTPAGAGNRKTWTLSFWMKLGSTNVSTYGDDIFFVNGGSGASTLMNFAYDKDSGVLYLDVTGTRLFQTNAVFRDFSSWYHVVLAFDSTQATSADRIKLYINGVAQTFSTYNAPTLNADYAVNGAYQHNIGRDPTNSWFYLDAYLAEMNLVDGQQLTASSFGETDGITGVWKVKKYGGTYGTNGFYLDFKDNSSTAALGYDAAGSNDWTVNNISLTAGTTYDSMIDVPTMSALGSNYAVFNPLNLNLSAGSIGLSDGNLTKANNGNGAIGTILASSGKYYCELVYTAISGTVELGVCDNEINLAVGYKSDGTKDVDSFSTNSSYGASYTTNDVIGIALDATNKTVTFYKNNTSQGSVSYTRTGDLTFFMTGRGAATYSGVANFGQRPFSYTPPTGFVALNTFNLPEPSIKAGNKYMDATTYTGNGTGTGSTQTISNGNFQPDFIWIKSRSTADYHDLVDSVRGIVGTGSPNLFTNTTGAEATFTGYGVSAVTSTGFTLIGNGSYTNTNGVPYVGWQWKANGTGSSNTAGSITSTVSANPTAGFSIVTYTGNSTNPSTIGHGLGVAPQFIIIKNRSNAYNWVVGAKAVDGFSSGKQLYLNTTSALVGTENFFSNTQPTSSVFTVKDNYEVNFSGQTYVAYCFAEVTGYSKFGSYTGNGSTDGVFVYTGFKPKFVMIKRSDSGNNWFILDTSRNTYNLANAQLLPNSSATESTGSDCNIDILSNGFKLRTALDASNGSGGTYIYMAFAETPTKYALGR